MGPDEPMEQLELGQVTDEHVVGDRVGLLGLLRGLAVVTDHAAVHHVQRAQVGDSVGPADGVVVPGAGGYQRAGGADRARPERGDPLGDLVRHLADRLDLRVDHLVHRDEVRADHVPVHVLEGQSQVVERVQPLLQDPRPRSRRPACSSTERCTSEGRCGRPLRLLLSVVTSLSRSAGARSEPAANRRLTSDRMTAGPLADLTVLDLTRALAGPHAAMMLGDLGARVIKVESPSGGDDTRGWGPPFVEDSTGTRDLHVLPVLQPQQAVGRARPEIGGRQGGFDRAHPAQRCADRELPTRRAGPARVSGVDRLTELNPRLVLLSISGFGHDGPEGGRAGYDQIAQGEAGLMSMTGPDPETPTKLGVPIADLLAGMYGAYGVLAALHERAGTGRGGVVRTSLLAAVVGVHAFQGTRWTVAGEVPTAEGPHHPSICPYGLFHSRRRDWCRSRSARKDCGPGSPRLSACPWTRPASPPTPIGCETALRCGRRSTRRSRAGVRPTWSPGSPTWASRRGQVKNLAQVYQWDQTLSQGLLVDVEHPTLGTVSLPGPPLRFFDDADAERTFDHAAPPLLGQHTDEVLAWLGAPEERLP